MNSLDGKNKKNKQEALLEVLFGKFLPFTFIILFMISLPLEPVFTIRGRTLNLYLGLILTFSWLFSKITSRENAILKIKSNFLSSLFFLLLIFWGLTSFLWASNNVALITSFTTLLQLFVLFIITQDVIDSNKKIKILFFAYSTVISIYCIYAISFTISNNISRLVLTEEYNPNRFARLIGISLIFVPYLLTGIQNKFLKIIIFVSAFINSLSFIMTGSRGSLLSLVLSFLLAAIFCGKFIKIISLSSVTLFVFTYIYVTFLEEFIPISSIDRFEGFFEDLLTRAGGRHDIWRFALEIIRENPILGVGLGNFSFSRDTIEGIILAGTRINFTGHTFDAHNTILMIMGQLGIIGLILFLFIFYFLFIKLIKQRKNLLGFLGIAFLLYFMIMQGNWGIHTEKYFWFSMGIIAGIPNIIRTLETHSRASK